MKNNLEQFGMKNPNSNFERIRDGRESMPLWLDIDLSVARSISAGTALFVNIAGNSFYVDADTTNVGNATVHFQDTNLGNSSAPFFVTPGFIANVGYTQILIENASQAGKRLRIFYGVDIAFQAGVNASVTTSITGLVNIGQYFNTYSANYKSITAMAANTPDTIFAPGANVNGAIVWEISVSAYCGGNPASSVLAKNGAPASIIDGVVLGVGKLGYYGAAAGVCNIELQQPIKIPAGLGLYYINDTAEAKSTRTVLYTLL